MIQMVIVFSPICIWKNSPYIKIEYFMKPVIFFARVLMVSTLMLPFSHICMSADADLTGGPPSETPDRIMLNPTGDPSTGYSVTWRTSTNILTGWAEIAEAYDAPGFSKKAVRVKAKSQILKLKKAEYNPDIQAHFHTVAFQDLEPSTQYAYRVGDGRNSFSEWFHFTTASQGFDPFSFVYVGDAQNGILSHWSRLIRQSVFSAPDMRFLLHAGDLINSAHMDDEWGQWFKATGWTHGTIPAVAVPGNHEYGDLKIDDKAVRSLSIQWQPQFEFPTYPELPDSIKETAYHFEYQGVLFVCLNSMAEIGKQAAWMDKILSNSNHQWKVVAFHYPIFASAVNRDNLKLRKSWMPILEKNNVDLVLQGHDHTYARGHTRDTKAGPIKEYTKSVYVNSVSGSKMYTVKPDRWDGYADDNIIMDRMAENTQLFQVLSFEHRKLSYKAVTATGKVYDGFELEKLGNGAKLLTNDTIVSTPERKFKNTIPY